MHRILTPFASMLCLVLTSIASAADVDRWPQWRGPQQNGVIPQQGLPTQWDEQQGIAWQVELPGQGGSTPVHDGEQIFVTAGVEGVNHLMAVSPADGSVTWDVEVGKERVSKHGKNHRKGSGANPSVVINDGKLFAYYRSGDLAAVTPEGEVLWHINLQDLYGEDTLWWNLGTSPIPTEQAVVVAVMQSDNSYMVAIDKATGKELWKVDRMLDAPLEAAHSYTTPLNLSVDGRQLLAVLGADHLTLHDAATGREVARQGGFNPRGEKFFRSIASPVAAGHIVICPYARGETLTAVDAKQLLAGKGTDAVLWHHDDLGADVPTPAARNGKVYLLQDKQAFVCLDASSGEEQWSVELPRSRNSFTASPLITASHAYATREDGTTFVIDLAKQELVQTNAAADNKPYTVASLVPIEDDLLLRTPRQLIRITEATK